MQSNEFGPWPGSFSVYTNRHNGVSKVVVCCSLLDCQLYHDVGSWQSLADDVTESEAQRIACAPVN